MATILEQYRERQNNIRAQLAANSLPPEEILLMQEINYRICVLETFEAFCKSAPVTMDTRVMGFHFQIVDAYVRFALNERKFGPKVDAVGQKKRETAYQSFEQVALDGRKRFSSFSAGTQDQYLYQNDSACMDAVPEYLYQFIRRLQHESEQLE